MPIYFILDFDQELRKQWIFACKRLKSHHDKGPWSPTENDTICSKHFKASDVAATSRRFLRRTAVPSSFKPDSSKPSSSSSRSQRFVIRYQESYAQFPNSSMFAKWIRSTCLMFKHRLAKAKSDVRNAVRREHYQKNKVSALI